MLFIPLFIIFFIGWLYHQFVYRRRMFPPGPMPLPFIGNFHQIDLATPATSMLKWRDQYGPIFTVWLPKPIVVLASQKVLTEALVRQGEAFAGRPTGFLYSMFTGNMEDGDGIILCQKERWSVNRSFAIRTFRDFGMGRDVMGEKIMMHLEVLVSYMKNRCGMEGKCSIDLHHPLAFCVGNIIHDLVMGRHYNYGDEEFERFKKLIDYTLEEVASVQLLMSDCYPWMASIFPLYHKYKKNGFALQNFFLNEIDRHTEKLQLDGDPRDFMEAYLREMKYQPTNEHFNKLTLALNSGDLWTGGMETTVTTIRWGIIYLLYYPTVQQRVHEEIDRVLCGNRVSFVDRNRLPYVMATINELQRIVNVLPWHIPHRLLRDTNVCGVDLAEGTAIMPQFGAVHMDPMLYPQPEVFKPERFLDSNGCFQNRSDFNPFGLGKRACLGENLARHELFLIFTTLMQEFEFARIEGRPLPSLKRKLGMTSVPQEYDVEIRMRNFNNSTNNHQITIS